MHMHLRNIEYNLRDVGHICMNVYAPGLSLRVVTNQLSAGTSTANPTVIPASPSGADFR